MLRFFRHGAILRLLFLVMLLVFASLLTVETIFLIYYRNSIEESAYALTDTQANELYNDINQMWYQHSLISGTFSRSETMAAFLRSDGGDAQVIQALRSGVQLTQLAADNIDSILVTDFQDITLFAYGARDARVLEDAQRMLSQGQQVKNPVHRQIGSGNSACMYCINCTEERADGLPIYTIIVYNIDALRAKLQEVAHQNYGTNLLLLDGDGVPLLESMTLAGEERARAIEALAAGRTPENVLFLQTRDLSRMNWRLVAFVEEDMLDQRMEMVMRFAYVMGVSSFVLLCAFFIVLRKQINEPIHQILDFMRDQTRADEGKYLELKTKNEIDQIAQGLNEMLRVQRIMIRENARNQERIYQTELLHKQSEIAALTHQINPHFLYNTLDCMRGMAFAGRMEDLEETISSLAYIFRYATQAGGYVRVEEEIGSIRRYMNIIRIRCGGRIDALYAVDEDARGLQMPKMALQPIVENAVLHGLEKVNRRGTLRISARREADMLQLEVADDGSGMDAEALNRLREALVLASADTAEGGSHIGLVNIHRRIRLIYGPDCGLTVESTLGVGTRVTLRMRPVPAYRE